MRELISSFSWQARAQKTLLPNPRDVFTHEGKKNEGNDEEKIKAAQFISATFSFRPASKAGLDDKKGENKESLQAARTKI